MRAIRNLKNAIKMSFSLMRANNIVSAECELEEEGSLYAIRAYTRVYVFLFNNSQDGRNMKLPFFFQVLSLLINRS